MVSVQKLAVRTKSVVFDQAIIAVMSASLIAPYFVPRINNVLDSVPILRDHKSISSLIAGMMPPILAAVIIGVSGAFILTAILPLYTNITNRGVGQ